MIEDPRIMAVTLTGSEPAGVEVAGVAARKLKKSVLELGGSDPFIVMPSANLDDAVKTAAVARNINNGQSCISAKRFIVHAEVYDAFAEKFVAAMRAQGMGDPMDEATKLGPLATEQGRTDVIEQVERELDEVRGRAERLRLVAASGIFTALPAKPRRYRSAISRRRAIQPSTRGSFSARIAACTSSSREL